MNEKWNQLDASFGSIENIHRISVNIHRISVNNPLKRYSLKNIHHFYINYD